jgi:uncharacterized protein YgiB involved in biofilm formation
MKPPRKRINASPESEQGGGRKRTMVITLLALGAGAVTVGNLTGAGSTRGTDQRTYRSVAQCEEEKLLSPQECVANFVQARQMHERAAPAFNSRTDCEREYGPGMCVPPSSESGRTNTYIPLMAAYLIGRRAAGGYQPAPMYRRPGDPQDEYRLTTGFAAPLPSSSTGSTSTRSFNSGSRVYTRGTNTSTSRGGLSSTRSSTTRTTTSRGGFGSSARSSGS